MKGWHYESARHAMSAKGIRNKYLALFKNRTETAQGGVYYTDPYGRRIYYAPGFEKVVQEGQYLPTPEDVSYAIEGLPKELAKEDVWLMSRRARARMDVMEKLSTAEEDVKKYREFEEAALRDAETHKLLGQSKEYAQQLEYAKMWGRNAAKAERLLQEGGFAKAVERQMKHKIGRGVTSGTEQDKGKIFVLPSDKGESFKDVRHTIAHEFGHKRGMEDEKKYDDQVNTAWYNTFKPDFAPTAYGMTNHAEDLAETFATEKVGDPDSDHYIRWKVYPGDEKRSRWNMKSDFTAAETKRREEMARAAKLSAAGYTDTLVSSAFVNVDAADKEIAQIREAERQYPQRVAFLREKIPGFDAPTARESYEAERSSKAAIANAALEAARKGTIPMKPFMAKKVDLKRYAGTWKQESVKNEPSFQKGYTNVTATYRPRPDGKITVINKGTGPDGKRHVAKGIARSVSSDNRHLKVSFAPFGLFEGNYNIKKLSPDYKRVVVKSGKTEWVLIR